MEENKTPSPNLSKEILKENVVKETPIQKGRGLSNNKPQIQKENFSVQGKKQNSFDKKGWEKAQEVKQEKINNRVDKEAVRQRSTAEKTNVQTQSRGGRGGRGGGLKIPDPFMQMQKTTPLYRNKPLSEKEKLPLDEEQKENLQLAMDADKNEINNPFTQIEQEKDVTEPQIDNEIEQAEIRNFQSVEDADKIEVNLSEEEKENLAFAMSMDEEKQFESFPEIDQEMSSFEADNQLENLGEYTYQEQEEIDQVEPIVSDEWKENLMLAMEETEPEYEGFSEEFEIAEIENDYSLDDLSFYDDDYSGSDESDSDGGSDGGGDGGGD